MLYKYNILTHNTLPPPRKLIQLQAVLRGQRQMGSFLATFFFILVVFFIQHFVNATTCAGSAFAFREPSRNNMLHQRSINNNKMPNFYIETLNFFEYEYSLVL